jgi:hypothetical protein
LWGVGATALLIMWKCYEKCDDKIVGYALKSLLVMMFVTYAGIIIMSWNYITLFRVLTILWGVGATALLITWTYAKKFDEKDNPLLKDGGKIEWQR